MVQHALAACGRTVAGWFSPEEKRRHDAALHVYGNLMHAFNAPELLRSRAHEQQEAKEILLRFSVSGSTPTPIINQIAADLHVKPSRLRAAALCADFKAKARRRPRGCARTPRPPLRFEWKPVNAAYCA